MTETDRLVIEWLDELEHYYNLDKTHTVAYVPADIITYPELDTPAIRLIKHAQTLRESVNAPLR